MCSWTKSRLHPHDFANVNPASFDVHLSPGIYAAIKDSAFLKFVRKCGFAQYIIYNLIYADIISYC